MSFWTTMNETSYCPFLSVEHTHNKRVDLSHGLRLVLHVSMYMLITLFFAYMDIFLKVELLEEEDLAAFCILKRQKDTLKKEFRKQV